MPPHTIKWGFHINPLKWTPGCCFPAQSTGLREPLEGGGGRARKVLWDFWGKTAHCTCVPISEKQTAFRWGVTDWGAKVSTIHCFFVCSHMKVTTSARIPRSRSSEGGLYLESCIQGGGLTQTPNASKDLHIYVSITCSAKSSSFPKKEPAMGPLANESEQPCNWTLQREPTTNHLSHHHFYCIPFL